MDGVTILAVNQKMTDLNTALFSVGLTLAVVFPIMAIYAYLEVGQKTSAVFCCLMILCAYAAYHGWTAPRETVVKAVLSQDVSWHELAERYEVLNVEGQILEMRERQNEGEQKDDER